MAITDRDGAETVDAVCCLIGTWNTKQGDYDRDHDSPDGQLSNFKVLEDREAGERKSHWLHADAYKYTCTVV